MIFEASNFVFQPPREIAFARRILIKPSARCAQPYPFTTSSETMMAIISGIRQISPGDILILERSSVDESQHKIYKELGYNFPNTILLDVNECVPVAVENPLSKPFALSTFWLPNVILSCDFLITIAPYRIVANKGDFSIKNLLGLLPASKYQREIKAIRESGQHPNIDNFVADLYFTLPFDLGIIDARKKLTSAGDPFHGDIEDCGKIFVGTPYEVDNEASMAAGVKTNYLRLIKEADDEQRKPPSFYDN